MGFAFLKAMPWIQDHLHHSILLSNVPINYQFKWNEGRIWKLLDGYNSNNITMMVTCDQCDVCAVHQNYFFYVHN